MPLKLWKSLGTAATHENDIHNEFMSKLISESSGSSHFLNSYLSMFFLILEHWMYRLLFYLLFQADVKCGLLVR
jgi:hypothetical protein